VLERVGCFFLYGLNADAGCFLIAAEGCCCFFVVRLGVRARDGRDDGLFFLLMGARARPLMAGLCAAVVGAGAGVERRALLVRADLKGGSGGGWDRWRREN